MCAYRRVVDGVIEWAIPILGLAAYVRYGMEWERANERERRRESERLQHSTTGSICRQRRPVRLALQLLFSAPLNVQRGTYSPVFPIQPRPSQSTQPSPSLLPLQPASVPLTSHPITTYTHTPPLALIPRFHPSVSPSRSSSPASRLPPPSLPSVNQQPSAARAKRRKLRSWGPRGCTVRLDFPCTGARRLGSLLHIYICTYIVA